MTTAVPTPSTYQRIKRRTFEIMEGEVPDKYSHFVEIFIALLVVANVIGIILESVPEIHEAFEHEFHLFDMFSVAVFSVEFVMRVWSYSEKYIHSGGTSWDGRKEYVFSFYGIIDFVSTVPFYLQLLFPGADLRVLRMFRLMRIFKLSRYNSAFEDMVAAVKAERDSFSSAVFLLFISCLLFSSLIYIIEGHEQPEIFPSIPCDALVCHHHHLGLGQCGPRHFRWNDLGDLHANLVHRFGCDLDGCGGNRLYRTSRASPSLV